MIDSVLGPILLAVLIAIVVGLAVRRDIHVATIYPSMAGLLYTNGQFRRDLPPGRYMRYDPFGRTRIVTVPVAERPVALPDITVLSQDRFSFRLALSVMLSIDDARRYVESQPMTDTHHLMRYSDVLETHPALYPQLAAAALDAAGARTLADITADPAALLAAIRTAVADTVPGATIGGILLTAINLPPETRKMFTDVERARMEALGALERARGEHAALRVLANAARLMTDNPALANLRLIQAVETSKGSTTIVMGDKASA